MSYTISDFVRGCGHGPFLDRLCGKLHNSKQKITAKMKTRKPRLKRAQKSRVNIESCIIRESLPLPFVHYPNMYGTFFVFSETEDGSVYMCSCAQTAVENLLALKTLHPEGKYGDELRTAPLDTWRFPPIIAKLSHQFPEPPIAILKFQRGVCHRCNLATPSLRYCHEMYGGPFRQHYGWYIEQTYLRLGILNGLNTYLPEACPEELQKKMIRALDAQKKYAAEEFRLKQIASGPDREDIARDEITYWRNVKIAEAGLMKTLRREASRLSGKFHNRIKDITREEFGFKKVGGGGVSETILFSIICKVLPGLQVLRHNRPKWLNGLELDIYVPDLKVAIEYQGQQHFHPIHAWGGERALAQLQNRDQLKAKLCHKAGVTLVTFDYTEPFTVEHVREGLQKTGLPIASKD